jgi:hypothetical protein
MDIKQINRKREKKEKREREEIDIKQNGQKTGHKHSKTYKSMRVFGDVVILFCITLVHHISKTIHWS